MLDVVFIMLIFFVVTASFLSEKTLGVNVPQTTDNTGKENNSILISVDSGNQIFMDGRRVDIRAVSGLIAQKHAEFPDSNFVVRAHELSSAETYVAIADAVRKVKAGRVSLVPFID